jgi:hypothetical protein
MAHQILLSATKAECPQYELPEAVRRSILAKSSYAEKLAEVERERQRFIEKYGDPFGLQRENGHGH